MAAMTNITVTHFNPRSPKGSDSTGQVFNITTDISIHAPLKGATSSSGKAGRNAGNFNPRSPKGSDAGEQLNNGCLRDFNPRSPKGSDNTEYEGKMDQLQFQSTLP